MNKRGQGSMSIFQFMVVAFLAVVLFGGLIYAMGIINDVFVNVGVINENTPHPVYQMPCVDNSSNTCNVSTYVNMSKASEQIFGQVNDSIQNLRQVALMYILAQAIIIILTNVLQKKSPIFFIVYVLLTLLAVIFAPTISNAYIGLLNSGMFGGILSTFTASNFLLINLPTVVMVIGLLGGILLFVNLIRGVSGEEGL